MDKIVLQYEADVSKLSADLNRLESSLKRTETSAVKAGQAATQAYQKPIGTINKLKANLETLIKWRDAAFSPGAIEAYNAKIRQTQNEINKLTKGTQNVGGSMKQVTSGALSGLTGGLVAMGAAGAAAFATQKIVEFGRECVSIALKAEGIERAFNRLNDAQLLDQLRTATKGTVSDLDLMRVAVQAKNFKIPLEVLAKAFAFAQVRARETGQSVDYLMQSIVDGLGRKSLLKIDNVGISFLEMQKEVNKTGDFVKAFSNVADREMKKLGKSTTLAADEAERLTAVWANFKKNAGEVIAGTNTGKPNGAQIIDQMREQEAQLRKQHIEELQKDVEGQKRYWALVNQLTNFAFDPIIVNSLQYKPTVKEELDTIAKLETEIENQKLVLSEAKIGSDAFLDAQKKLTEAQKKLDEALGKQTDAQKKAEEAAKKHKEELQKLAEESKQAALNIEKLKIALMPDGPIKEKQQLELQARQDIDALVGTAEQVKEATELINKQRDEGIKAVNDKYRMQKIDTNRLPTTIPETNFYAQAQQEKENTDKTEAEKWEIRRFWSNKALDMAQTIEDAIYEITRRRIEAENELLDAQHEADMKRLEDQRDRRTITEAAYNKQRKKFDEDYYAKQKELRIKAAKAEKADNIFKIIINTARAIVEAMPDVPLSIIAGVTGAIQLGVAASQPIPQFKKGTLAVKGGVPGKDSVPALLAPNEAVIPADKAVKYNSHLEAMMHGDYEDYLTHRILMPYIRRHEEAQRKGGTAERLAEALKLQNVNNFDDLNIVTGLNRLNSKLETTNKLLATRGREMDDRRTK